MLILTAVWTFHDRRVLLGSRVQRVNLAKITVATMRNQGYPKLTVIWEEHHMLRITALVAIALFYFAGHAQVVEVDESGDTGKAKAKQYFKNRKPAATKAPANEREPASGEGRGSANGAPRFLAIHVGMFLDDQSYKWGKGDQKDIGQFNLGVTYRLGEWVNSMDFMMRAEYTSFALTEDSARKLGLIFMVMFPDANSHFPLYFGAGAGPGFFIKQIHGQSIMSLDYEVVAGARFLNVIDNLGFFVEFGLKDHIHLFSEGQYNGLFVSTGTAWTF
jgi:hypothetical protein